MGAFEGSFPIPNLAGVNENVDGITSAAAGLADQRDIVGFVLTHGPPTKFDGAEALIGKFAGQVMSLRWGVTKKYRTVGPKGGFVGAAQELVDRAFASFAGDIPQGNFDTGHGVNTNGSAAVVIGRFQHLGAAYINCEWICSFQGIGQTIGDLVGKRRFHYGLDYGGCGVDLAPTSNAGIGFDLDKAGVLGAIGGSGHPGES